MAPAADPGVAGVEAALAGFGRRLRARGLGVGPDRLIAYRRAVALLDAGRGLDLADIYWAGRVLLTGGRAELAVYDQVFAEHFLGAEPGAAPGEQGGVERAEAPGPEGAPGAGEPAPRDRLGQGDEDGDAGPAQVGASASAFEVLRHKAFGAMTEAELAAVHRLLRALRADPPLRRGRRTRPAPGGRRLDLRRSVRTSLRTEGELVRRRWRRRRLVPRPLVLVLDVSGSMTGSSRALLHFAYGLARTGTPVEVFCFGTRLTRITPALRGRDPDLAIERAAAAVVDWDGGTRIGDSLRTFVRTWGRQGFVRRAVVLICSDALERGDVAVLGEQMARLARLAHRVVWVNPLAGDPDFEPVSRGMRAVLPHIDELAAGDTLERLATLAGRLGRVP